MDCKIKLKGREEKQQKHIQRRGRILRDKALGSTPPQTLGGNIDSALGRERNTACSPHTMAVLTVAPYLQRRLQHEQQFVGCQDPRLAETSNAMLNNIPESGQRGGRTSRKPGFRMHRSLHLPTRGLTRLSATRRLCSFCKVTALGKELAPEPASCPPPSALCSCPGLCPAFLFHQHCQSTAQPFISLPSRCLIPDLVNFQLAILKSNLSQ